jgi:hypothetical protein
VALLTAALVLLESGVRKLAAEPALLASCRHQTIGPILVDVPSVEVRPQFRLNGKPFPGSGEAAITLWASEPSDLFDGPQLSLGLTSEPAQPVRVVPGVYDVYYSWHSGSGIPRNQLTRLMRRVSVSQDRDLVVNVPMVELAGVKHHNGFPFVDDGSLAELSLRHEDGRGYVILGGMLPSPFSVRVIPGRYFLEYDWRAGGGLPRNQRATVRRMLVTTTSVDLRLDVPSVLQHVEFLHNGAAFPASVIERGDVYFTRSGREELAIGSSHSSPVTVRLIPGTYDAHWRYRAGSAVPRNEDARFKRGVRAFGSPLVVDVPSLRIVGDIRLKGQAPPASDIENAQLSLVVPGTPDRVSLGQTRYGAYEVRVVPARYDVVYEHLAGSSAMPANPRSTLIRAWRVATQPNRTIDIPAGKIVGAFFLNGEAFPASEIETGTFYALPLAEGDPPVQLGRSSYGGPFERILLPGLYQPAYGHDVGSSVVPRNGLATVGRPLRVLPDNGTKLVPHTLDLRSATLVASYEHHGTPLPVFGEENARIHLLRGHNYLRLWDINDGPGDQHVVGGRFDVFYQYVDGTELPRNAFMRFACWNLVP